VPYNRDGKQVLRKEPASPGERFAALIRHARAEAGVSQEELAEGTGISRSQLIRWESGRIERPDPESVRAVCAALEIDPREAAVALGYLTHEEAFTPATPLPPRMLEVLELLEDPAVPAEDKEKWIDYLVYLRQRAVGAEAVKKVLERDGGKQLRKIPKSPLPPGPGAVGKRTVPSTVPREPLERAVRSARKPPLIKEKTPPTE